MFKANEQPCHICQRLGKSECGYHRFKNEQLSKIDVSSSRENHLAQTQYTNNGTSPRVNNSLYQTPPSPSTINRPEPSFQYSQPRVMHPPQYVHQKSGWTQNMPPQPVHYHHVQDQPQQRVIPIENHIVRTEGNQVLYYPIYPVYEVVYEPVENVNGSFLTNSRSHY